MKQTTKLKPKACECLFCKLQGFMHVAYRLGRSGLFIVHEETKFHLHDQINLYYMSLLLRRETQLSPSRSPATSSVVTISPLLFLCAQGDYMFLFTTPKYLFKPPVKSFRTRGSLAKGTYFVCSLRGVSEY